MADTQLALSDEDAVEENRDAGSSLRERVSASHDSAGVPGN
jgi:hypothetical protein